MRKSKKILFLIMVLVLTIIILECFKETEKKVEVYPTKSKMLVKFKDDNTDINIDLVNVNADTFNAKMINNEINDYFYADASKIIKGKDEFVGRYYLLSESVVNSNILSIRIYLEEEVDQKLNRKVYTVNYDMMNDVQLNLSQVLSDLRYSYESLETKINEFLLQKDNISNGRIIGFYLDKQNKLQIIIANVIGINDNKIWENIHTYEYSEAESKIE